MDNPGHWNRVFILSRVSSVKQQGTYPRNISHSVDGNLFLAVQTFPVLDGPTKQKQAHHQHCQNTSRKAADVTDVEKLFDWVH